MSDIAIRVEGLSKRYRIGKLLRYKTLRDSLAEAVRKPVQRVSSLLNGRVAQEDAASPESLWALKDVSFEVKRGEVVGIIGRNGAGKSTLLKILSRITEPTAGYADVYGRVGSLLEVGTGFHPELTGHENIYLNGAILGMRKNEIARKFDEIVAFAEVERFLDTPIKYYSSGMYIRLAFAVAAHLEPEILLVDEVLAVGDSAFQKKCLGKMGEVVREGHTVLFVSHNMPMVLSLCERAILLDHGRVVNRGDVAGIVEAYLRTAVSSTAQCTLDGAARDGAGHIRFRKFSASDDQNRPWLVPGRPAVFTMELEAATPGLDASKMNIALGINASTGERLLELHTRFDAGYQQRAGRLAGRLEAICRTKQFPLKPGRYLVTLYVDYGNELCDRIRDGVTIEVRETDYFGTGASLSTSQGWLLLEQEWCCTSDAIEAPVKA